MTSKAPIHGILSLICLFVVSAYLFISYFALEFIGVLFLVIYVGAVAVLFVFVVIILPSRSTHPNTSANDRALWGFVKSLTVVAVLVTLTFLDPITFSEGYRAAAEISPYWGSGVFGEFENDLELLLSSVDVFSLGQYMYRVNSLPLVASAVLLFVALVVAIIVCDDQE